MSNCVDRETAKSRGGPDVETEAARQAHYIKWAEIFGIQDPCGYYSGYQRIVAIYTKYIQKGVNYNNKQALQFATVQGYAKAVNTLFKLRGFAPPADLSDPSNMTSILINNMLRKEDIACQRAPLDCSAAFSKNFNLVNNLLFDFVSLSPYISPRLSEYAQTTQDKVDYHTYPSGTMVIKAFVARNFIFYDVKKHIVKILDKDSFQQVRLVKITWHIQKNHQNGQAITLSAEVDRPEICPVCSAMRLVLCARRLNQPDDMPLGVYRTKKGESIYLTGNKIAELLWKAVKSVRPDTTSEEIKRYSAHSLRVWSCVLLDEAGKPPDYIKRRLHWLCDSFRMYLQDTLAIQLQHVDALREASWEVMDLISALPADVIAMSISMTNGTNDPDMNKYANEMD
jgi:hypothetical protein